MCFKTLEEKTNFPEFFSDKKKLFHHREQSKRTRQFRTEISIDFSGWDPDLSLDFGLRSGFQSGVYFKTSYLRARTELQGCLELQMYVKTPYKLIGIGSEASGTLHMPI